MNAACNRKIEHWTQEPWNRAQKHLDSLIKPPGSLGILEESSIRLAGITGVPRPSIEDKVIIVMEAIMVVEEGVSITSRRSPPRCCRLF